MATDTTRLEPAAFRGDFEAMAGMLQQSWASNNEVPLLYTASFLESACRYPGTDFNLSPSIYNGDEPLAFVAGLPRHFEVNGERQSLILTSFLTAAPGEQNSSYGLTIWRNVHNRAREAGYAGVLSLCVEGDQMNKIISPVARLFRLNTQHIFRVDYLMRFLRPAQQTLPEADCDIDLFLELARGLPQGVPFARVWTREEAEWQCRLRSGAVTASMRHGERHGMLTGYVTEVASKPPVKALAVEDILWGNLEDAERKDLLQQFLLAAAARGAQVASCPVMNYADLAPFRNAGFRPAKRRVHIYLTHWKPEKLSEFPAVYMDVL